MSTINSSYSPSFHCWNRDDLIRGLESHPCFETVHLTNGSVTYRWSSSRAQSHAAATHDWDYLSVHELRGDWRLSSEVRCPIPLLSLTVHCDGLALVFGPLLSTVPLESNVHATLVAEIRSHDADSKDIKITVSHCRCEPFY